MKLTISLNYQISDNNFPDGLVINKPVLVYEEKNNYKTIINMLVLK